MKRVAALIILLLLVSSSFVLASERHFEYKTASENDMGVYVYFKVILIYSEVTLDRIIAGENESIDYVKIIESRLNTTRDEVEFYRSFGIESKVGRYLPPFLELCGGMKDIAIGQRLFLDSIDAVKEAADWQAYINASLGLEKMESGISRAEKALDVIATFEFVDENNNIVTLDTSPLRERLEKIKRIYTGYERVLNSYSVLPSDSLVLYVSNPNPIAYENVTFYGYAPNLESVDIHVENKTITLKVNNNRFSYVYSFDRPGKYEIFATGAANGSVLKSNVLEVNVSKVPTKIILSSKGIAYINESIRVKGLLLDHYGRPLPGETVFWKFGGKNFTATTSEDGSFSLSVISAESGEKRVDVTYPGSEIYEGSSASINVAFLRYPVKITLRANGEKVKRGENLTVTGEVTGVKGEVPIEVYVDGKLYASLYASRTFEVSVGFNTTGRHEVYAYFPGNSYYSEAKSNVLTVDVVRFSTGELLFLALLLALLGGAGYLAGARRKKREGISDEEFVELIRSIEELEKAEREEKKRKLKSIVHLYRDIYHRLIRHYNLKPSLTPRELVSLLRNEGFAHHLEKVTRIHERYFYGKKPLKKEEIAEYLRHVAGFIVSFVVRDEL